MEIEIDRFCDSVCVCVWGGGGRLAMIASTKRSLGVISHLSYLALLGDPVSGNQGNISQITLSDRKVETGRPAWRPGQEKVTLYCREE